MIVHWDFLDYMLGRLGFGKKYKKWMKKILWNGSLVSIGEWYFNGTFSSI